MLGERLDFLSKSLLLRGNDVFFLISGGILDCTAYGVPPPQITWLRYDPGLESPPLTELTSGVQAGGLSNAALWQILAHNNSLKFRSFSASDYNPTVHKAAYVCRASSESGIILSRIVNVKSGEKNRSKSANIGTTPKLQ